jgi:hypothetical protein
MAALGERIRDGVDGFGRVVLLKQIVGRGKRGNLPEVGLQVVSDSDTDCGSSQALQMSAYTCVLVHIAGDAVPIKSRNNRSKEFGK